MLTSAEFAQAASVVRASRSAVRDAWAQGQLWWLLDHHQFGVYQRIREGLGVTQFFRYVLKWARRTGKTWLLMLLAIEESIRHRGHRYNIAASTKESLAEFVWPTVYAILDTCPLAQRKRIDVQETHGRLVFHAHRKETEQTRCVLAGCNDSRSVERLRGPYANGNIYEEIGAMPDAPGLNYVEGSVLGPQTLTTGGWTLMAGTPPKSTDHEAAEVFRRAEADGRYWSYATLYDNPRLSEEQRDAYLAKDAERQGMTVEEYLQSPDYRREWRALVETDPSSAVFPACTPQRMWGPTGKPPAVWREGVDPSPWIWRGDGFPPVVRIMPDVPMFRDRYVSMDLGFHPHFTFILFGYWDYGRKVLVIEDELMEQRLNDTRLARLIGGGRRLPDGTVEPLEPELAAKVGPDGMERKLWGEHPPFLRVCDNNYPMTISELAVVHGLVFAPTAKDEKEAAVLHANRWFREGKIAVHPRCKHTISQMPGATWNKHRTEFAEQPGGGHYDGADAMVYMVRNVIPNQDRVPEGWGRTQDSWRNPYKPAEPSQDELALLRAFGGH